MPERISPKQTEPQNPIQTRTRREMLKIGVETASVLPAIILLGLRSATIFGGLITKPEATNPQDSSKTQRQL